jgi:S1-C subfamily serine protease
MPRPRTPLAARLAPVRRRLPARVVVPVLTALLLIVAVAVALTVVLSSGSSSNNHVSSAALREADRWLGVQLVAGPGGSAVLETVAPNGPAAFGGLEPGDVISQVDGKAVDSLAAAVNRIDGLSPGQQVLIVVDRGSALAAGTLVLPARPGSP